jgi:hypothetical protein
MHSASTLRGEAVSAARGSRRRGRTAARAATPKRPSARAARLAALIAELENAVEAVGIRVRRERLMREVEIELLALTLSGRDLSTVEMSPEARRLLASAPVGDQVDKPQSRP